MSAAADSKPVPRDAEIRERFRAELDRNFSVIAPAGAGKTRALVDRIVALAERDQRTGTRRLAQLVVVTYTNKAAEEMQQRARSAMVARHLDFSVLALFNRAFFGTIHSFCLRLLQENAHLLGLPSRLNVLQPEDALWNDFVRHASSAPRFLDGPEAQCLRYVGMEEIFRLARSARPWWSPPEYGSRPRVDIAPILHFPEQGRGAANIRRFKDIIAAWYHIHENQPESFCGLPVVDKGGEKFQLTAARALDPLKVWVGRLAWAAALKIAHAYRAYRIARGYLTYTDQIYLTHRLLHEQPEVLRRLRRQELIVLLDEAQDTDPLQFDILLEITRPEHASCGWRRRPDPAPGPGRFCMVGDPQQSIYPDRADLEYYDRVRSYLENSPHGEEIIFEVTFRCDSAVVTLVNQLGPVILPESEPQARFVRLEPRPGHGPGMVLRLRPELPSPGPGKKRIRVGEATAAESRWLARWLADRGYRALGASDWSQVAILCQQRKWLDPVAAALDEAGLRTQVHSPATLLADHPAYSWLTALLRVLTVPADTFNCVGVLREIFGISDDRLAAYSEGDGNRFRIDRRPSDSGSSAGEVDAVLDMLRNLRVEVLRLPLREAVGRVIGATALPQRVAEVCAIPAEAEKQIDTLLGRACEAERRGLSLHQFVQELLAARNAPVEAIAPQSGAVQILTCHKAKGLEWDVVILPMFFRPARPRSPDYPILLQPRASGQPVVLVDKQDYRKVQDHLRRHRRAAMQRLLYVALTRARRTLVILDDREAFSTSRGAFSFGELLGEDGGKLLERLPSEPHALPLTPTRPASRPKPVSVPVADRELEAARAASGAIVRRILPSMLAREAPPDEPELLRETTEPSAAEAARRYGTWWHRLMETMPWGAGRDAWAGHFRRVLRTSPDIPRARREWNLFLKSPLAARLADPSLHVESEMPFLHLAGEETAVEGFMDLVQRNADGSEWMILDWKTNLITEEECARLAEIYCRQLRAYAESLQALTGAREVTAVIYATCLGRLIPV